MKANVHAKVVSERYIGDVANVKMKYKSETITIIIGNTVGGWFIAFPDDGICCKYAEPTDQWWCRRKLSRLFGDSEKGFEIADALNVFWRARTRGQYLKEVAAG